MTPADAPWPDADSRVPAGAAFGGTGSRPLAEPVQDDMRRHTEHQAPECRADTRRGSPRRQW